MTKLTHGGSRKGSGRPTKYGEPTEQISLRIPKSRVTKAKQMIREFLEGDLPNYARRGDYCATCGNNEFWNDEEE